MSIFLRRRVIRGVALALALVVLAATPASAATARQNEIEQEKSELRRKIREADAKAKTITQQISESDARRAELERKLTALERQLSEATARLVVAEQELGVARDDLYLAESAFAQALKRLDRLHAEHSERARAIYKRGAGSYVDVLLGAADLSDLFKRVSTVEKAMQQDKARQKSVERLADQLAQAKEEAVQHKVGIEQQMAEIEAERANITRISTDVHHTRQQVLAELSNRKKLLTKVQSEKAEYLRRMQQLERESRSIAALLRSRQAGQVYRSATGLVWPTTGVLLSSYGWRVHPIFGDRRFHAGIDISAPSGRAVLASLGGQVVFAGNQSGYGLTVVIDHGNSFGTLYAHLSSADVHSGQSVAKGARIAGVGCTGYCTGPHLHFETRIKGEPVDPMQFF